MNEPIASAPVRVTDVDIPLVSMVWLLIKWSIAAIPAIILLAVIFGMISLFVGGLFGALALR